MGLHQMLLLNIEMIAESLKREQLFVCKFSRLSYNECVGTTLPIRVYNLNTRTCTWSTVCEIDTISLGLQGLCCVSCTHVLMSVSIVLHKCRHIHIKNADIPCLQYTHLIDRQVQKGEWITHKKNPILKSGYKCIQSLYVSLIQCI